MSRQRGDYCEKCIRAHDERDPAGARGRALARRLFAGVPSWPLLDSPDSGIPPLVCLDCPACGRHVLVDEGQRWCAMCHWELRQVEDHVGAPVETGFKVGDVAMTKTLSMGTVRYVDPCGFVDLQSEGWMMRLSPRELRHVRPRMSRLGDLLLGAEPLPPGEYPPFHELLGAFEGEEP